MELILCPLVLSRHTKAYYSPETLAYINPPQTGSSELEFATIVPVTLHSVHSVSSLLQLRVGSKTDSPILYYSDLTACTKFSTEILARSLCLDLHLTSTKW